MDKTLLTFVAASLLASGIAGAGETHGNQTTHIAVAEVNESGQDPVYVELSGDQLGFELEDMQIGESRAVVDSAGQDVLITRTEDGFDFAVDGRNVSVPAMDGHQAHVEMIDFSDGDFVVEIAGGDRFVSGPLADGITIISPVPLDAATQSGIRSVLQSAGHTEDVTFVESDSQAADRQQSEHMIKVVRKGASPGQ